MTYLVEVTQGDIDNGKPRICGECAIALAAARSVCVPHVKVHSGRISWYASGRYRCAILPRNALTFIGVFDDEKHGKRFVSPFSFQIEVPD